MSIGIGALVALRAVPYLQVELGHVGRCPVTAPPATQ